MESAELSATPLDFELTSCTSSEALRHVACTSQKFTFIDTLSTRLGPAFTSRVEPASMSQELVAQLKSTVDKLEARVEELESRLKGNATGGSGGGRGDGMRMILMGPPGAGMFTGQLRLRCSGVS